MGQTAFHGPTCSCDLSLVIFSSKQLEVLLERDFEANGKGLHEKISSAKDLPESLKRKLRRIATIRNKLVHHTGFNEIPDRESFLKDFQEAKAELTKISIAKGVQINHGSGGCFVS